MTAMEKKVAPRSSLCPPPVFKSRRTEISSQMDQRTNERSKESQTGDLEFTMEKCSDPRKVIQKGAHKAIYTAASVV